MPKSQTSGKKETHRDRQLKKKERAEIPNQVFKIVLPTLAVIIVIIVLIMIFSTRKQDAS